MTLTVEADALRDFATDCYRRLGMPDASAAVVADSLVQADLWGHPSHGVMRLFWYAARLESGATVADALPQTPDTPPALLAMDGRHAPGQMVTAAAMTTAIRAAKAHGIGAVAVRNSGHFGTAMYFTRMAAQSGCIGFLSTNASPAMAAWGGRDKQVGTNPFSWAALAGRHPPMMLDIANTAVARGKLYIAKARGEAIPEGWAIDAEGRATTDPAAGIAGTILPMAGHKGFGLGLMMDVVSGVLSGSAFGTGVTGPYVAEGRSGAGHLVIAIDIESIRHLAAFEADMERLIGALKAGARAPGVEEILYPGEPEARAEAHHLVTGVPLPGEVAADLATGARKLGIAPPF
ncbi:MAG: Ldh family oxidoreductase [Pseudomonadota bacterium]